MRLDSVAVHRVADRICAAAELIDDAIANHLTQLAFDGARAGREHAAKGDALRVWLDRLTTELSQWSRAATEIAVALRSGVDRYCDAERYAAARIA